MKKVSAVGTPAITEHLIALMEKDEKTIQEFLKDLKGQRDIPFFHQQVFDALDLKQKTDIFSKMTEVMFLNKDISLAELRGVSKWNFENNTEVFLNKITNVVKNLEAKEKKNLLDNVAESLRVLFVKDEEYKQPDLYVSIFKALNNIEEGPVKRNIKKKAVEQIVNLVYSSSLKGLSGIMPKITENLEIEDLNKVLISYVKKFPGVNALKDDISVILEKRKESEEDKAIIYLEIERNLLSSENLDVVYFAKEYFNKHNSKLTFLKQKRESLNYDSQSLERLAIKVGEESLGLYAKMSKFRGESVLGDKLSLKARRLCLDTIQSFPKDLQEKILKSRRRDLEGVPSVDKLRLEQLMVSEAPKSGNKHRAL